MAWWILPVYVRGRADRYISGPAVVPLPSEITINPLADEQRGAGVHNAVNFGILLAAALTSNTFTLKWVSRKG